MVAHVSFSIREVSSLNVYSDYFLEPEKQRQSPFQLERCRKYHSNSHHRRHIFTIVVDAYSLDDIDKFKYDK